MKYVYYGLNKFDRKKIEELEIIKQNGGLLAKEIDKTNMIRINKHFVFRLKEDTKILTIDNDEQLKKLSNYNEVAKEYDAIVFSSDLDDLRRGSIIVFNLDKIIPEKNKIFFFLILIITLITIFVYLFLNKISINGTTPINKATWDIHYDNLKVSKGSVKANKAAKIINGSTAITYEVPLKIPGEFYEFSVDVVNEGTMCAEISHEPTLGGINSLDDEYLNYTVTYSDGSEINVGDILDVGETVTFKVRIEFDRNIEVEQLPKEEKTIDLLFSVNYVQKK